ncbi:hypothetical protein SAMN05421833_13441 [Microbispora rosea]|uniref:Uncharacterized protein n=1 Tax=Microbispora rosea TaxID=58117 RepID=A0A1N7GYK6_9ACTN|nr:hypothetical protein [Microbispora rosea]GIH47858.1 hypothetical protein Mro03_30370 [Microbispora rosea subsp. rosea]SIS17665.1 hypothetical protein SAMN05421833_13441 [Microbispora rosea]
MADTSVRIAREKLAAVRVQLNDHTPPELRLQIGMLAAQIAMV